LEQSNTEQNSSQQNNTRQAGQSLFREKTLQRISSPEKLTEYLRVTNPGIWIVLGAIILLLGGLLIWSAIGTLETKADAKVIVEDHVAMVVTDGSAQIADGMPLRILSENYYIAATAEDDYGRVYGITEVALPDGSYEGTVVVEQVRPIDFLLESK
jgi:hypothetical protein